MVEADRRGQATRRRGLMLALVCALALVACGDDGAMPEGEAKRLKAIFEEGLRHPDAFVQAEALRSIQLAHDKALVGLAAKKLEASEPMLRAGAAVVVAPFDGAKAQGAATEFLSGGEAGHRVAMVRELLGKMEPGQPRRKLVTTALRDPSREVRRAALLVGVLPRLPDPDVGKDYALILAGLIDHEDTFIGGQALRALYTRGEKDRLKTVLNAAREGTETRKRRALEVLAEAGLSDAAEPLGALEVSDDMKELHALALAASGDATQLGTVRDSISASDEANVTRCVRALAHNTSADAYRIIRSYREDRRANVRMWAHRAMGLHPNAKGKDFKRGLRDVRDGVVIAAIRGLLRSDARFFPAHARSALREPDNAQRFLALLLSSIEHMRQDNDAKAIKHFEEEVVQLHDVLKEFFKDPNPLVRTGAAEVYFAHPKRDALYKAIAKPSDELSYAWVSSHASVPIAKAPPVHLETFTALSESPHLPTALMSAGAIWGAYRAGRDAKGGGKGGEAKAAPEE